MKLRKEVRKTIHQNIGGIAIDMDKSVSTIIRWLYRNNEQFAKKPALKVLKKHTGLTEKELFEE